MSPDVLKEGFIALPRRFVSATSDCTVARLWRRKRQLSEWEAFLWLMLHVAHQERQRLIAGESVTEARGQLVASARYLADQWGWHRTAVVRFLQALEGDGEVRIDTTNQRQTRTAGATLTLCRYDAYTLGGVHHLTNVSTPVSTSWSTEDEAVEEVTAPPCPPDEVDTVSKYKSLEEYSSVTLRALKALPTEAPERVAAAITTAVNRGYLDNPRVGELRAPTIVWGTASSHKAADTLREAGVPTEFAVAAYYRAASLVDPVKLTDGEIPRAVHYFTRGVIRAWQTTLAKVSAQAAAGPVGDVSRESDEVQRELAAKGPAVDERRKEHDGGEWWSRMRKEAIEAARHPVLYAYDHLAEAAWDTPRDLRYGAPTPGGGYVGELREDGTPRSGWDLVRSALAKPIPPEADQ